MPTTLYIGLDVHKASISVTVAEDGRNGEVKFLGTIANTPEALRKLAQKLSRKGDQLAFCYEAGCLGYQSAVGFTGLGHSCVVAAPTLIPVKPGDRIKNDRQEIQRSLPFCTGRVTLRQSGYRTKPTRLCAI